MFFELIILKNLIEIILHNYNLNYIYSIYFSYEDFLTKFIKLSKKYSRLSVYLNIYFVLSIVNKKSICFLKYVWK